MEFLNKVYWFLTVIKNTLIYCIDFFIYKNFEKKSLIQNEENIEGKVVVVTGGSLGMGKEAAKQFAKRGAIVVIGDVDMKNGQNTVQEIQNQTGNLNVKLLKLDLSEMDSVGEFAKKVSMEFPKVKILLNNAGIGSRRKKIVTNDGFDLHVAVNYMGHFLLTNLLLDNLKAERKSRVVSITSTMQLLQMFDIDDLNMDTSGYGYQNMLPYANTKYCNSLFTKELAKRVSGSGITTYALCPGLVKTTIFERASPQNKNIAKYLSIFMTSASEAASKFIMYCTLDKSIENETGKTYRHRKPFHTIMNRLDDKMASRLWDKSSKLVNLQERLALMSELRL